MRIKEVIKNAGFTYEDIAKAMNTSGAAVSQIVNGNPTIGKLEEIAKIIGVSRGEFFLDEISGGVALPGNKIVTDFSMSGVTLTCPHCGKSVSLGLVPATKKE